eukprot:TRINITY_DN1474_c0_g1_i1.p2 TRINITY_DN1474_c0_g1~~TRINITY_DN1474_c0_g1_i1.p2  ORF type:complete len:70 (-),score=2.33 TRINITY_DN1474_c0_g1_i1:13-222(-)
MPYRKGCPPRSVGSSLEDVYDTGILLYAHSKSRPSLHRPQNKRLPGSIQGWYPWRHPPCDRAGAPQKNS